MYSSAFACRRTPRRVLVERRGKHRLPPGALEPAAPIRELQPRRLDLDDLPPGLSRPPKAGPWQSRRQRRRCSPPCPRCRAIPQPTSVLPGRVAALPAPSATSAPTSAWRRVPFRAVPTRVIEHDHAGQARVADQAIRQPAKDPHRQLQRACAQDRLHQGFPIGAVTSLALPDRQCLPSSTVPGAPGVRRRLPSWRASVSRRTSSAASP